MSPRDLARAYASDERLFSGRFFSQEPVRPAPGDRVGVVLLVPGAPEKREDVYGYLYHRLMLPPGARSGMGLWWRHIQSRLSARLLSRQVISEYSSIGGGSSINRLNREQCLELGGRLKAMDNVLLAPHNSNSSPLAWERVHHSTINNMLAVLQAAADPEV